MGVPQFGLVEWGLGVCVVASERVSRLVFYVDLTICIDSVIYLDYPTHVDALI